MYNFRLITIAALSFVTLTGCPPPRQAPGPRSTGAAERRDDRRDAEFDAHSKWDKLGERWVDGKVDRDIIDINRRETYSKIKLVVEHSAVEIWDIVITFGNGDVFKPPHKLVFGKGETSREIDVPGKGRYIQRIEFRYGNLPGGGRAQVEVWGLGSKPT